MAPVLVQEHAALVHGLCVAAGVAAGAAVLALEVRRRGAADERLLVVLVLGIVLASSPGSPQRRGIGLGLVIGWGLLLLLAGGLCIALIAGYSGG